MANFNRIAPVYGFLKTVVFGNQLEKAVNSFLEEIPSNSKVLIVGGGTGEILTHFNSSHYITYLELSDAMLTKSKGVNSAAEIKFVKADILTWKSEESFDVIITPFLLDCFTETELDLIFPKFAMALNSKGKWIHTDFYPKDKLQKFLIRIMYVFFNLTTGLRTRELADFELLFKKNEFICTRKGLFYHSMVESKIYQKIA